MTIRKEKLESFKQLLLGRREALATHLRQATQDAVQDEVIFADTIDQATAETDKVMARQINDRGRVMLLQIDEALRRIDLGVFGECERCDEEISEARLKAFPFTTLCIDCKAELESEESRFLARA